jgi:hypothetical protein
MVLESNGYGVRDYWLWCQHDIGITNVAHSVITGDMGVSPIAATVCVCMCACLCVCVCVCECLFVCVCASCTEHP